MTTPRLGALSLDNPRRKAMEKILKDELGCKTLSQVADHLEDESRSDWQKKYELWRETWENMRRLCQRNNENILRAVC